MSMADCSWEGSTLKPGAQRKGGAAKRSAEGRSTEGATAVVVTGELALGLGLSSGERGELGVLLLTPAASWSRAFFFLHVR